MFLLYWHSLQLVGKYRNIVKWSDQGLIRRFLHLSNVFFNNFSNLTIPTLILLGGSLFHTISEIGCNRETPSSLQPQDRSTYMLLKDERLSMSAHILSKL